jgi:hypothetical protein
MFTWRLDMPVMSAPESANATRSRHSYYQEHDRHHTPHMVVNISHILTHFHTRFRTLARVSTDERRFLTNQRVERWL